MSRNDDERPRITREQADELIRQHTVEISDQAVPRQPKVSVCIITYAHAHFISQALEGALMQEADFPYEIIVGDDHSTDGAAQIVLDYQKRYPDKIRVLLATENLGKYTGNGRLNFVRTLRACRGEYVALLEGDDYWTDRAKLQLQVEFLDNHPGAALCHHLVTYLDDRTGRPILDFPWLERRVEQCSADLLADGNFIQTCSLMLRRNLIPEPSDGFFRLKLGDWPLCVLVGRHGWIGYLDRNLATYRLHNGNLWASKPIAYRLAAGNEMAMFLIPHLKGATRRAWIDSLLEMRWRDVQLAAAGGPSARFKAKKDFLASAIAYGGRLPHFVLERLRRRSPS